MIIMVLLLVQLLYQRCSYVLLLHRIMRTHPRSVSEHEASTFGSYQNKNKKEGGKKSLRIRVSKSAYADSITRKLYRDRASCIAP